MPDSWRELALLALLSPLFLFPPAGHLVLTLIVLLPAGWLLVASSGGDILPRTPLNGSLALLLLMVLVSLYATFDVLFSAPKVLGVVFGVAAFFAIVRAVDRPARLQAALALFALAGAALALIGMIGTNWIDKLPVIRSVTRHIPAILRGIPGQADGFQPNAIAGALVMFVPLQVSLLVTRRRALYAALLLVTSVTLLLTQSRSGYLSLAAGFAVWALWHGRRSRWISIVLLIASGAGAFLLRDRINGDYLQPRVEIWSRAITMISDFPFTGVGMNGFRRVMPVMYPAFLSLPGADVAHAHNHLLQAALDLGLPGLVAYLALWFGAAVILVRLYRTTEDAALKWVVSGAGAGMIAYFLFGTADAIALGAKVGIFFWVLLALIVSLDRNCTA